MYGWDQVPPSWGGGGCSTTPTPSCSRRSWFSSGQLAFATRASGVPVLCYNHKDARSFAFWSRPEDWVGRDGILVSVNEIWTTSRACYERFFERIEPLGEFEVARAGARSARSGSTAASGRRVAFPFLPGEPDPSKARVADDRCSTTCRSVADRGRGSRPAVGPGSSCRTIGA